MCTTSFYEAVADRLYQAYPQASREQEYSSSNSVWVLHRAVAHILAQPGVTLSAVRDAVSDFIEELSRELSPFLSPALSRLVKISEFNLFVVLTPDDLILKLMRDLLGENRVLVSAYSPTAASDTPVDLPLFNSDTKHIFFPLGRCANTLHYAVHEEDTLEYLYNFNDEALHRAPNVWTELRRKNLLFIGCDLPDWLGRGFLRIANENRLSSLEKSMEFFCGNINDTGLKTFLKRFSRNSAIFPYSSEQLIDVLHGHSSGVATGPGATPTLAAPVKPGPTVFVSYASDNLAEVQRIIDLLPSLGFSDVWFDRKKLVSGDDWANRIGEAIEACDFFMPILSKEADVRREGVFWEEWSRAQSRSMRINDAFLLPVGIDSQRPEHMDYQRIYNGFVAGLPYTHTIHAPNGTLSVADQEQLRERCRRFQES